VDIAASGTWVYDGSVRQPVDVVALPFDFWYEIARADGDTGPDEIPAEMGPDGVLYYVRFRMAGNADEPTWVDSGGQATLAEAKAVAERRLQSDITWSA
jgi:hypothetical protein